MARTITATERANVSGIAPKCWAKLEIWDSTSTFVDYSTGLLGVDFLNAVRLSDDIDQNAAMLSGALQRCAGTLSLSPFMASSALNLTTGSYATKLDLWRKWRVSTAVMQPGYPPTGTDWKALGEGRIDNINVGDDEIQIDGRSEEAILLDRWMDTERVYGSGGGIAMETVLQSMLDNHLGAGVVTLYCPVSPGYLMNTWVQPRGNLFPAMQAVAQKAGFKLRYRYDSSNVYRLTLFKPNRTAVPGDEVWTLGPAEYSAVTLNKISKPPIRNFIKLRFAHPTLGVQCVIYPHMAGTGTVACTAGAATFSSSQAGVLQNGANIIVAGIPYTVSAFNGTTGATLLTQLSTGGVPTFTASAFTAHGTLSGSGTTTSIARFGRVDEEFDLSYDTQVNDSTKGQGMCDAIGGDSEFPDLAQGFLTIGAWFIQLHDYGKFLANGVHYDQEQYGGVTEITHDLTGGMCETTLGVRGKPAGAYTSWRALATSTTPEGVPSSQNRDTKPVQLRLTRVSETTSQVVIRAEAITPNVGNPVTITYSNGGLTVSPAVGQVLAATTDFSTTPHVDFTITKDASGGTQRRVAFTGSAAGYVDGTDGVDVTPNATRNRCKLVMASTPSIATGTTPIQITAWTEAGGGGSTDIGGLHDDSVNPSRITVPTGGGGRPWRVELSLAYVANITGDRFLAIYKNGTVVAESCLPSCKTTASPWVAPVGYTDPLPADGDYYEAYTFQNSGGALNISSGTSETFFSATDLV